MKLYNRTKCPDEILKPLLVAAGRAVGARTGGVVVKVTQNRTARISGTAHCCASVKQFVMFGFERAKQPLRWIRTDGGYFTISLPNQAWMKAGSLDSIGRAADFYDLAMHEWGHIKDYQDRRGLSWSRSSGRKRRPNWQDRPEEKRAMNYVHQAKEKIQSGELKSRDDLILNLAVWLDERRKL